MKCIFSWKILSDPKKCLYRCPIVWKFHQWWLTDLHQQIIQYYIIFPNTKTKAENIFILWSQHNTDIKLTLITQRKNNKYYSDFTMPCETFQWHDKNQKISHIIFLILLSDSKVHTYEQVKTKLRTYWNRKTGTTGLRRHVELGIKI